MQRKFFLISLVAAIASAPLAFAAEPGPAEIRLSEEQMRLIELQTSPATVRALGNELTVNGEVTPNLDRMVEIQPRAGGTLRDMQGRLGEAVRAGTTLAVVESSQIAEAEAAFLAARSRAELANSQLAREEALWQKKISAEQDVVQARQQAAEAGIALKTAERKLRLLGLDPRAGGARASGAGSVRLPVTAPFEGTIIEKHGAAGDQVSEATTLFRLANLDTVWVIASVHENDIGRVAVGRPAIVTSNAYPDRRFEGRVTWVADLLDEKTRTLKARIELDNKDRALKPGSFVRVRVTTAGGPTLVVPAAAVQRQKAERIVFVETAPGTFQRREIKIGQTSPQAMEILDGLAAGEKVVTTGAFALKSELEKGAFADND